MTWELYDHLKIGVAVNVVFGAMPRQEPAFLL